VSLSTHLKGLNLKLALRLQIYWVSIAAYHRCYSGLNHQLKYDFACFSIQFKRW